MTEKEVKNGSADGGVTDAIQKLAGAIQKLSGEVKTTNQDNIDLNDRLKEVEDDVRRLRKS